MMTWKRSVALLAVSSCMSLAFADDGLESLLDEASTAKKIPGQSAKTGTAAQDVLTVLLPKATPDQSLFINYVKAGEWDKALLQYSPAFEGTPFQKSANGRAIFALAHFKSGMPIAGTELFFKTVENPTEIHPEFRKMWHDAAPESHFVWDLAQIKWMPKFAEVFSSEVEYRVRLRELALAKDITGLNKLYDSLPTGSAARARVGWQLVISNSVAGDVTASAKALAELFKTQPPPVSPELMNLTAARLLYQRAQYSAAIKYYEKIPKTSEYWTDAQEEMAWSYIRKGQPGDAVALSKSLIVPSMAAQVGPESFFVSALSSLKICDYPQVMETLKEYPKRFKERASILTKVAHSGAPSEVSAVIKELKGQKVSRIDLGKNGKALPRLVARDEKLFQLAQTQKHLEDEAKAADAIYAKSLALTGLQGYFDGLRQSSQARASNVTNAARARVKDLAAQETEEIKEILRKLHIVEAEVIQQVSVAERVADKAKAPANESAGTTGSKARDVLVFPGDDEVWFDEIGNYRVNVKKACHAKGKSS